MAEKILDHSSGNVAQDFYHRFKASQMGEIGITVSTYWMVPKYQTISSSNAASRALDFAFGWI
ncbi:beta-glucosidase 17 [Quercus suber]|uniref:Beta-glucosidase 17 n=1 Tax=Quercus suber TaxID=58331 RepID=A0AAW0L7N4_QUESU